MPAPTGYTLQSFEDYLKFHVLQETAYNLGWAHDLPETPVTWAVILVEVRPGADEVRVEPLKYHLAPNTELTFVHRVTAATLPAVKVTKPAYPDEEHIFIESPFVVGGVNFELEPSVNYRAVTTTPTKIPLFEPVFEPVIRDTLSALEVSDITTVTGVQPLNLLRTRGRMEIWRKVMDFTSFDYSTASEGASLERQQIYDRALMQYEIEANAYYQMTNVTDVVVATSEQSKVKVVW